ncbi:glutathione hydrolase 1 proenzyme isoform X3 [Drosophila eugracilis]|uniref:glutathione hydrolase 1 proenzyme isoform X3 n=1 Tax=Drosophila eugracilis TaxID=29029 RepID=UPI0007E6EB6F|nr:glutathione hydrolase 1 proenzyme isoform X3 [Drosophila eugracilis]
MHSTACGVGASATNLSTLQSSSTAGTGTGTGAGAGAAADAHKMVHHSNEDAMNKIPLKSAGGLDSDEEKNGGELMQDTAAAEEARREQMRVKVLAWMKKLTIVLICFIGIALISYVIISLCFSDEQQQQETETETGTESIDNLNLRVSTPSDDNQPNVAASTAATTAEPPAWLKEQIRIDTSEHYESVLGAYQHGAVSSDNLECSKIGSGILQKNGSAVDAAIAALLCNGLLTLQSMGIGGGHMMNVYQRDKRHATAIDAREVAPYDTDENTFDKNPEQSFKGPLSIAVPGEVMGYYVAHEKFGQLPWSDLVAPSLNLCEKGYHVSQHMERALDAALPFIKKHEQYQIYLNGETGKPHAAGTVVKPPKNLCKTYKLLAENGPLDLYNGTLAKMLVDDLKDIGSVIVADDLEAYQADVMNSITMDLGDDTLYVVPPVSSGSLVAHTLAILQGYNFTEQDLATEESRALTIHRFVEAMKFAFAQRPELGDMHFIDAREIVSQLNSPDFGDQNRAKINDSHVLPDAYAYGATSATNEDLDGTSNLVVLAPNGDAVSVTSSINAYFGSGLIGPRTGIVLNNGMNDFSVQNNYFGFPEAQTNKIAAHKRAMSSQSPVLLADSSGDMRMVIGAAGGSRIIPAVVEVIANVLWFGDDLRKAVDAPRFYHQLLPDVLEYEDSGFPDTLLKLLAKRGHKLKVVSRTKGSIVTAISRNATAIYANADYRKRGGVAGF